MSGTFSTAYPAALYFPSWKNAAVCRLLPDSLLTAPAPERSTAFPAEPGPRPASQSSYSNLNQCFACLRLITLASAFRSDLAMNVRTCISWERIASSPLRHVASVVLCPKVAEHSKIPRQLQEVASPGSELGSKDADTRSVSDLVNRVEQIHDVNRNVSGLALVKVNS